MWKVNLAFNYNVKVFNFTFEIELIRMKKENLKLASILFTLVIILWPVLAIFSLPEGNNYTEQIESIRNTPLLHILNFIVAFLIAPAIIYMLFELYKDVSDNSWSILSKFGFILYALYFILVSISYGSQFLYLPFILESTNKSEILKWYFYNSNSLSILFNQTGYLIWSIATLLIFIKYLFKNTLLFFIVKLLTLSALCQIIGTVSFYTNNSQLSSLTLYSGIILLPTGILIIVYSFKKHSNFK